MSTVINSQKKPDSPAATSMAYDEMLPRWELIEAVRGGTETMRAAAELYLPRHTAEIAEDYLERLNAATLDNYLERTLTNLAARPFREPINIQDTVPKRVVSEILPDIDLQGNNLDVFAYKVFEESIAKAFSFILVEFPRPPQAQDGKKRTLADDRAQKLRPYWVHVRPENVIFIESTVVDGVETLTHVRIRENTIERVGWSEQLVERIRVLEPGVVRLFRRDPAAKKPENEWQLEDEWPTSLPVIPLVPFYTDRKDVGLGKPPMLDLAYLNCAHWQSSSDQRHCLTVARFPMLAGSGISDDVATKIAIGPNVLLYTKDPQGKFYFVEHQGLALESGAKDLAALEDAMSAYGAQYLREQTVQKTATASALDSAESTTILGQYALRYEDALALALDYTAMWMKLGGAGGRVKLADIQPLRLDDTADLNALYQARSARDISREAYLEGLKLRGVLPEDYDAEADMERITEEQTLFTGTDLNPGDQGNGQTSQDGGGQADQGGGKGGAAN